jgi:hypothetical protein
MTQEFSKPATTLLRAREHFAVEKRFSAERAPVLRKELTTVSSH